MFKDRLIKNIVNKPFPSSTLRKSYFHKLKIQNTIEQSLVDSMKRLYPPPPLSLYNSTTAEDNNTSKILEGCEARSIPYMNGHLKTNEKIAL